MIEVKGKRGNQLDVRGDRLKMRKGPERGEGSAGHTSSIGAVS